MDEKRLRDELSDLKKKESAIRKSTGMTGRDADDSEARESSKAMRYTWLGAEFAAIFFGFVYGGHFLDQRLGTKPWLILIGICAGFSLALYRLIFVARRLSE
jgi:F0F1-type ATP synthase assembly protein I